MTEQHAIWYIRLVTGEELFGGLVRDEDGAILVEDALRLEEYANGEGTGKYLFMGRFAPWAEARTMSIAKRAVAILTLASPVMADHYKQSLEYTVNYSDPRLASAVRTAATQMEEAIGEMKSRRESIRATKVVKSPDEEERDVELGFVMGMGATSNTRH